MINRKLKKSVKLGNMIIGGNSEILIQTMLKTPSFDIKSNIFEAIKLQKLGCEILRVAIPDMESVKLIDAIKSNINIPLVADIHFDYRLAIESAMAGADKIRINPGNIGDDNKVLKIVKTCKTLNIPIRIGVNSGSINKKILQKYQAPTFEALYESAFLEIERLNKFDFDNIVISIKSSDVLTTIKTNILISEKFDYPIHIGITEAGSEEDAIIKSSIGIGSLLTNGIGDTIRIALTGEPEKEIAIAKKILQSLKLRSNSMEIISCPTCGRTKINIISLVEKIKEYYKNYNGKAIKLAIMGCAVNGPGEAKEANIGVACGKDEGLIFKNGKVFKKVKSSKIFSEIVKEVDKIQVSTSYN